MANSFGVIGSPIEHSLSPAIHEFALKKVGLEGASQKIEVASDGFLPFIATAPDTFDALSVTAPLKELAFQRADVLSESAKAVQAVNSLKFLDGKIEGHNTDGLGFMNALKSRYGSNFADSHVVVLGAGGAARSIIHALVDAGVASIAVHGRSEENVERACKPYGNVFGFSLVYRPVDLIVNTIPVLGRTPESAVLQGVSPDSAAVDIAYEPRTSEWLALYEQLGCETDNGLRMLAFQAAAQLEWWLDQTFDGDEILESIK
jgi:shikimate dehydrogenase